MRKATPLLALFIFASTQLFAQIDTVWSENWEGDWIENWYVDGGTWEVGDATSGPDTAYAGAKCAATVLAGNYNEGVRSRLVRLTDFIVPSRDQNPRLQFWHWFSFHSDDYGYVQIKTENGVWQNISSKYRGSGSNAWSFSSLDLSPFADSLVQIAFYFHSDNVYGSVDVSSGWYIDNTQFLTGNYIFDSNDEFENGQGDWSANGGTWEVGIPTSGPGAAYLNDICLATVLDGNYAEGVRSHFISPPFRVMPATENPALRFWHWYSFSSDDFGEVYLKTPNQDSWQLISNRFEGTSSGVWTTFYSDLSGYADSVVQIAFYFRSDNVYGSADVSTGWYIDDMRIDGVPLHDKVVVENDLAVQWMEPAGKPLCGTGREQAITIQVNNHGKRAVSNFEVEYSIDDGLSYVSETVFETIGPGGSLQYVFRRKADMAEEDYYYCRAGVSVVYDVNDTNDDVSATIENEHLEFDIETTGTTCNEATGTATITSIGGRPGPYEMHWTTGDKDLTADNLASGVYFVTITDALGCSWTKSFTINDIGAPEISLESSINGISCFGMNDGNINIVPVGGVQPYSYRWSNGDLTQAINELRKGQYDVTITDADGCAKNHSFLIEEPAPLRIKAASEDAICGEMNGSAQLRAAGGTQPYAFKWNSDPAGFTVSGLSGGLYTAFVTDSKGCTDFTTVSISEIDAPQIIVTSVDPASCGHSDGGINIGVADVTLNYIYSWSDGSDSQDVQDAPAGFYSVTVSHLDESCSASQIIEIPTQAPPSGEICMISVDSITEGNIVVIKDPVNPNAITSANIYYLSKTGSYQYMKTLNPTESNTTPDAASNTDVTSYRYRITQVDGCGNESEPSAFHETMHVVATPDYSLHRANLFWNSYKGVGYNFFKIYRYSDLLGLEIIDSIPRIADKEFYTYTDLNPPEDMVHYVVVIELPEACNSRKKSAGTHNTIRSNKTKKLKVQGEGSPVSNPETVRSLNIYPNPNKGSFRVSIETLRSQDVLLRIFDAQGKLVWTGQFNDIRGSHTETLELRDIKPGIYHIQFLLDDGIMNRSFIVE